MVIRDWSSYVCSSDLTHGNLFFYDLTIKKFTELHGIDHPYTWLLANCHRVTYEARAEQYIKLQQYVEKELAGVAPDLREKKIHDFAAGTTTFGLVAQPGASYLYTDQLDPLHARANHYEAMLGLTLDIFLGTRAYSHIKVNIFFKFRILFSFFLMRTPG